MREPVRVSERLLIQAATSIAAERVLCTSLGRAQFAAEYLARVLHAQVWCHFLDLHSAQQAREATAAFADRLTIGVQADFPAQQFDAVCLPLTARGDGELTRDLLQAGHQRLIDFGQMIATTDHPKDTWLHGELKRLFEKVTRTPAAKGAVYRAIKTDKRVKLKNYDAEFMVRDGERLIRAVTRPGVFSHRHIDVGARALLETMEVQPGFRVLELGCGSGIVSLAAALRFPNVHVVALDSNPRAIQCTERGAELNEISRVTARLDADAESGTPGQFDLVLANPPYYSHFRIGEIFLRGAARALKTGGVLQLVTKRPDEYQSRMPDSFHSLSSTRVRSYSIVRAVRK